MHAKDLQKLEVDMEDDNHLEFGLTMQRAADKADIKDVDRLKTRTV
jgi:hypothetical protein